MTETRKRKWEEALAAGQAPAGLGKKFKPTVKATFPLYIAPRPLRSEKKFIDTQITYTAWNVSRSYILLINGVSTGTDYNNRVGRSVMMTSTYHRYFISDSTNIQMIRVMLVYDKQSNGAAAPGITDILQYADANSPMNLNNRDRFVVISDKVVATSPNGTEIAFRKKYKKLRTVTVYGGTGAAATDIISGALYFVAFAFNNVATSTISGYSRTRFLDQ